MTSGGERASSTCATCTCRVCVTPISVFPLSCVLFFPSRGRGKFWAHFFLRSVPGQTRAQILSRAAALERGVRCPLGATIQLKEEAKDAHQRAGAAVVSAVLLHSSCPLKHIAVSLPLPLCCVCRFCARCFRLLTCLPSAARTDSGRVDAVRTARRRPRHCRHERALGASGGAPCGC